MRLELGFSKHAIERAEKCYGLTAAPLEWRTAYLDLLDTIFGERTAAVLLARLERGGERWLLSVAGQAVIVIYQPMNAAVVTVVPAGKNPNLAFDAHKQLLSGRNRARREREIDYDC